MRPILYTLALVLFACAAPSHHEATVAHGDTYSHIGLTYQFTQHPQKVVIKRGMPADQQRRVVVHELGHVAGLGHAPFRKDIMYRRQGNRPWWGLGGYSVIMVRFSRGTVTILNVSDELRADVEFAVAAWNRAAFREVFLLE